MTPVVIDSLELILSEESDATAQVDLMNDLSIRYYRVSVQREEEYARKALHLAKEIEYNKGEAVALKNIGIAHRTMGSSLDSILFYYHASLSLAAEYDYIDIKIALLNNIGLTLGEHGQYHEALNYMLRCIDLEEANMPITWKRPLILANIGDLYYQLKDYETAQEYFNRSYDMGVKYGHDHINLMHVDNRALTKYKLGEKENAQRIITESLDLIRSEGDFESLYQSMLALIEIQIAEDLITSAKRLGLSMMDELEVNNLPIYRCKLYDRLADIEIMLENEDQALDYSLKSLECFDNSFNNIKRTVALERLYKAYQIRGDVQLQDSIHREYVAAAELEFDRQIDIAVGEEEYKYQNLLNQREIELLKQKQMSSAQLNKYLTGGILVFLILSLVALSSYIRRNKIANTLAIKNRVLTETEQTLEVKNAMLEKYIESNIQLSQFAHIASHDLKSPLRTVSSFIGLTKNSAKERLTPKELEYMDLTIVAARDMHDLVNDLLSYSKVNALELKIEEIDMNALFAEVKSHLNYSIKEKETVLNINLSVEMIYGDRIKLRQVFENLLSNSIKFVAQGQHPKIEISCISRSADWLFEVKDNGIGIDDQFITQVFEPFRQLNSKDAYSGTGLGLALCHEIVKKHQGKIWVESTNGVGTHISFTISKSLSQDAVTLAPQEEKLLN